MDDLSGKQLGPYQIVAPLGEGGMAVVYKAFQPSVNRYVALKVLPQYFARDPEFAARFEREAQLLARLQHPNILPVFDFGRAEDASLPGGVFTYIAMPLIQGGSLEALMRSRRLDYATIGRIMTQLGDALDYAHSRNLIHRDIKPANVLLDESGNCLLTDFGLARMVEGAARLTSSGAVMGTPAYMSPEQGRGLPLDRRTDIYSLGVILYEMTVGRPPFEADTPMVVLVKHINDPLPLPSVIAPNFPPALERVIVKALAKDPAQRYQTAGALVEALNAAWGQADGVRRSGAQAAASVVAASPRVGTHPPAKVSTGLLRHAWWAGPLVGLAGLIGLAAVVGSGLLAYTWISGRGLASLSATPTTAPPRPTAPALSQAAPTLPAPTLTAATLSAATLPTTAPTAAAGEVLLSEDFENGLTEDWTALTGTMDLVALPNGNQALKLTQSQFGGAVAVYRPAFTWAQQDYTFEADVMVADAKPDQTSVRLDARIPAATDAQSCLGYAATLGANWANLSKVLAEANDCNNNSWQDNDLALLADGALKPGVWQHLRLEVQGHDLQFYVDNTLIASADDFANGWKGRGLGLSAFQTDQAYFDNVRVQARSGPLPGAEQKNWVVSFAKSFPAGTWPPGDNSYGMSLHCNGGPAADTTVQFSFTTADNLPPPGGRAFLTNVGLRDQALGGAPMDGFNPAYPVLAVYSLGALSRAEVDQALANCQATMAWSGNSVEPLKPLLAFQH